jgi:CHAT domain-containing protein/tetratricopeptide (TPR) repeat protein
MPIIARALIGLEPGKAAVMAQCNVRLHVLAILLVTMLATGGPPAWTQDADNELSGLNARVVHLYRQGKYAEALSVAEGAVHAAERRHGSDHPELGTLRNSLGALYRALGRYDEAEAELKRGLEIAEKAVGPDHPNVGAALANLAGLYEDLGRYAEAEPLFKRDIAISEKALGPGHLAVGGGLNNLAALYQRLGRYEEAEPLHRRALGIFEAALGSEHPDLATLLNNLGELYRSQGRDEDAEPLFSRALAIAEKALAPEDPRIATLLSNLAELYRAEARYGDAEPLHRRSLAIREKALGIGHPEVGASLNNLGLLLIAVGRQTEAEPVLQRALAITEQALGPDHPDTALRLNNLAVLRRTQGRDAEAAELHVRGLAIREKALGPDHPDVGQSLNNLAVLAYLQSDWARAAHLWRRSTAIVARRMERGVDRPGQDLTGESRSETEQLSWQFWGLVKAAHRLSQNAPIADGDLRREMFATAQWALASQAATSVAQMAIRGAKGDPALGVLIRERQDLVAEWRNRDRDHRGALARPSERRDRQAETRSLARLAATDARIGAIDRELAVVFPDYAAFASPAPATIDAVQADLRDDEALVLILDTPQWHPLPEDAYIWVVTRGGSRWVRSELGTQSLAREVAALRCGLDAAAWLDDAGARCADLLGSGKAPVHSGPPPFDHERAHKLYKAVFGAVEDLIAGKHLLVVASGPLSKLPFNVLVTEPPVSSDHRTAAWLPRRHALTVLPSVSSLRALRRVARASAATKPMIGFGNPLIEGPDGRYAEQARLARAYESCRQAASSRRPTSAALHRGGVAPLTLRAGLADLAHVKAQIPLPETADELCSVSGSLGGDPGDVRLGDRATEGQVKALSDSGALAQYRIVHFATHGTLAGQLAGTAEPGLILTPPAAATAGDDGYLSASEVAGLRLDADWVILSACNTAAGGASGAEALSGLARAFFYAQARALLVSHWEVDSLATVKLITSTVGTAGHGENIGRAEALRRSMLALIDHGAPQESHPSIWAPFVIVGEGTGR